MGEEILTDSTFTCRRNCAATDRGESRSINLKIISNLWNGTHNSINKGDHIRNTGSLLYDMDDMEDTNHHQFRHDRPRPFIVANRICFEVSLDQNSTNRGLTLERRLPRPREQLDRRVWNQLEILRFGEDGSIIISAEVWGAHNRLKLLRIRCFGFRLAKIRLEGPGLGHAERRSCSNFFCHYQTLRPGRIRT